MFMASLSFDGFDTLATQPKYPADPAPMASAIARRLRLTTAASGSKLSAP